MRPEKKKIMLKELHNKLNPRSSADVLMCILSVMQKIGPCLSVITSKTAETVIAILVVLFRALIYSTMLMINIEKYKQSSWQCIEVCFKAERCGPSQRQTQSGNRLNRNILIHAGFHGAIWEETTAVCSELSNFQHHTDLLIDLLIDFKKALFIGNK